MPVISSRSLSLRKHILHVRKEVTRYADISLFDLVLHLKETSV